MILLISVTVDNKCNNMIFLFKKKININVNAYPITRIGK